MNYNFVVIRNDYDKSNYYDYIYYELIKMGGIYINRFPNRFCSKILFKILFYNSFLKFVNLLIMLIIVIIITIKVKLSYKRDKHICFIFSPDCFLYEKFFYFNYLRLFFKKCKIIYFFSDLVSKSLFGSEIIYCYHKHKSFDLIYSFDYEDAKKYNLKFHNIPYSDLSGLFPKCEIKYDISFVGKSKDRLGDIISAYKTLSKQGLKCGFFIVGAPEDQQALKDEINYCKFIPYKDYLKIVSESRCILEIMQKGGTGNTIRVSEAISLDKLLISNNKMLLQNSFYDSKYMRVYENLEELDVKEFIESNQEVHYENKEKIYPSAFFKQIEKDLEELDRENI